MPNLAEDPSYVALQRALGFERSTSESVRDRSISRANEDATLQREEIVSSSPITERNIAEQREASGLYRSGRTEQLLAEARARRQRALSRVELGVGRSTDDAVSNFQQSEAQRAIRRAEAGIDAAVRLDTER